MARNADHVVSIAAVRATFVTHEALSKRRIAVVAVAIGDESLVVVNEWDTPHGASARWAGVRGGMAGGSGARQAGSVWPV